MREQNDCTLVRVLHRGSTIRLSCRAGDYILCVKFSPIPRRNMEFGLDRIWKMGNNDTVTITNRFEDLPDWFELMPSEIAADSVFPMKEKQSRRYRAEHSMEKPNVWRMLAGDKIVWVGTDDRYLIGRSKTAIVDIKYNAVVIGESKNLDEATFGQFDGNALGAVAFERLQMGFQAAKDLGFPWHVPEQWSFG